jgi:hypothetical protein
MWFPGLTLTWNMAHGYVVSMRWTLTNESFVVMTDMGPVYSVSLDIINNFLSSQAFPEWLPGQLALLSDTVQLSHPVRQVFFQLTLQLGVLQRGSSCLFCLRRRKSGRCFQTFTTFSMRLSSVIGSCRPSHSAWTRLSRDCMLLLSVGEQLGCKKHT